MVNIHLPGSREETVAVCDVGVGGAAVAVLSLRTDAPAKVLATGHSALTLEPREPEQAVGLISRQVQEAGAQALASYAQQGHHAPVARAYIIVHAPWMTTRTLEAGEVFGGEEYIHDTMVGKLAKQALAGAAELDRAKLIEASVVRVELNGYATAQPAGKHAHQVRVVSLASECEPAVRAAVAGAVQAVFPVATLVWRSGIRALMTLARESAVPSRHYLIVDMGVDTTHIASVRGASFEQRVVPEGIRTILARVGGGKMPEEILGSLRMLARDACSTESCEAVQKALATAEPELLKIFAEPIGQMAATRRAASDLLLVTNPDMEPWLAGFFSRIDFSQFTVTTLPFTVCTPSSIGMERWVTGDIADDSLAVGAALVNIEARA